MLKFAIPGSWALAIGWLALAPSAVDASEPARIAIQPLGAPTLPQLAVQYELKLRLPKGEGLARSLLDVGVDTSDASLAARLAAGHMGAGAGGCSVKISFSKTAQGRSFRLVRVMLVTQNGETVIERRHGELAIASEAGARGYPRLV